jgi:putative heme-binding domain-containing protein
VLQERAADKKIKPETVAELNAMLKGKQAHDRLRALWTLHAIGAKKATQYLTMIGDENEDVRDWAYRFFFEVFEGDADIQVFETIEHPHVASPRVQLAIASGLQRPKSWRDNAALLLLSAAKDAGDPNLPHMVWYAIEPQVAEKPAFGLTCLNNTSLPFVRQSIARRLSSQGHADNLDLVTGWLNQSMQPTAKHKPDAVVDVLQGMLAGLAGSRQTGTPKGWNECYALLAASDQPRVRELASRLAVQFGDARAIESLRKILVNAKAEVSRRESALQALLMVRTPDLLPALQALLEDQAMRGAAVRALAAFNEAGVPQWILKHYSRFNEAEKADAVQTLASRPAWAIKLLDAIEAKQLPRADVSVFVARQIQGLKDKQVQDKLAKVWGKIQPASKEKVEQMAKFKKLLTSETLKAADLSKGRLVFAKNCAACHRLYDDGGDIGPALTGSQRHNLDYVLENVLDPSAVVAKEYQMVKIDTQSGRTINGIVKQETEKALTIQTPNEMIVLPKDEIENRAQSPLSMMPEGLFDKLKEEEIRDLVAYLASKQQTPLPKGR